MEGVDDVKIPSKFRGERGELYRVKRYMTVGEGEG